MDPISLIFRRLRKYVKLGRTGACKCPLLCLEGTVVWQFREKSTGQPELTETREQFFLGDSLTYPPPHLSAHLVLHPPSIQARSCTEHPYTPGLENRSKSPHIAHLVLDEIFIDRNNSVRQLVGK